MNEITLLPADNYVVVNKTILTDNDKVNLINFQLLFFLSCGILQKLSYVFNNLFNNIY